MFTEETQREMSEQIARLTADRDRWKAAAETYAKTINDICGELYGKGFRVLGWHLNGDEEPLDSWFDDNGWESIAAALAGTEEEEQPKPAKEATATADPLTAEERADVEMTRVCLDYGDEEVSGVLARDLLAIIDRLTGKKNA